MTNGEGHWLSKKRKSVRQPLPGFVKSLSRTVVPSPSRLARMIFALEFLGLSIQNIYLNLRRETILFGVYVEV